MNYNLGKSPPVKGPSVVFHFIAAALFLTTCMNAQDEKTNDLKFYGDFRFRIEHDWNSLKSDGTFREDRSRLRYRGRFGLRYQGIDQVAVGARVRTGDPKKQQDPQLTLGDNFAEFNTLPIGLELFYASYQARSFEAWVGKNTFPFIKQNELFWSDNVFPEGISARFNPQFQEAFVGELDFRVGHFILRSSQQTFNTDSYFQGLQMAAHLLDQSLSVYSSLYIFNEVPDIPDGNEAFTLDYTILNFGAKGSIAQTPLIRFSLDYYLNTENLSGIETIPVNLQDEKSGIVGQLSVGQLAEKGNWKAQLIYAYLERFAAVDFLTQNDWARWSYSSQGSPDGRLTNLKGFEFMLGYALNSKMDLQFRAYSVDQIVALGSTRETGDRVRLDLNIRF